MLEKSADLMTTAAGRKAHRIHSNRVTALRMPPPF
jgi:hypothetical protein